MESLGLLTCLLTKCCIDDKPPVRGFGEEIEINDLLDQIGFKGMPPLCIDNYQFMFFECRKPLTGDLNGILFLRIAKAGYMNPGTECGELPGPSISFTEVKAASSMASNSTTCLSMY